MKLGPRTFSPGAPNFQLRLWSLGKALNEIASSYLWVVGLVVTGGSLTRRLQRSLCCLLAVVTWQTSKTANVVSCSLLGYFGRLLNLLYHWKRYAITTLVPALVSQWFFVKYGSRFRAFGVFIAESDLKIPSLIEHFY